MTTDADVFISYASRDRERVVPAVPLHGLSFSPHQAGQDLTRGTVIGPAQLEARLRLVQPHTRWIRAYAAPRACGPAAGSPVAWG